MRRSRAVSSSADATAFPITPLLFTADEMQAGTIDFAIHLILPNPKIQAGAYVHPASHGGGPSGRGMPPYDVRVRLRANYPLASLPDEGTRVIARALQRYGMFLRDGGTSPSQRPTIDSRPPSGATCSRAGPPASRPSS